MGSMGWGYVAVMAGVTFATRALPATLIRRKVTNRFLRSFLYYVPYVTLAVMTFPAILGATGVPAAGAVALLVGIALAWRGAGLFEVSGACCARARGDAFGPGAVAPSPRPGEKRRPRACAQAMAPIVSILVAFGVPWPTPFPEAVQFMQ